MSTCTVDEDAIRAHFTSTSRWAFLPYIGPAISSRVATPLPEDHNKDLGDATSKFDASVDQWQNQITTEIGDQSINLNTLVTLLPTYVEDRIEMTTLPMSFQTNVLWVQVISIAIILGILIFFGRY